MAPSAAQRLLRSIAFFALQAAVWIALTVAFAALVNLAGWSTWTDALLFSATNWVPWILIAPAVFWLASRFPFERGQLWRSVPVHVVACAACMFASLWASAYSLPPPPGGLTRGGLTSPGGALSPFGSDFRRSEKSAAGRTWGERGPTDWSAKEPAAARGDRRLMERGPGGWSGPGPMDSGGLRGDRGPGDFMGREGGRFGPRPPGRFGGFFPPFSTALLRANFSAAVYLIVALAAHALGYYRRAQERERHALVLTAGLNRMKLEALRLQLQPHFLFNTLNAISTLVHRDADAADELITDLSELLRLSLQTSDHEVPLSREIELLDCYLAIEQTRLGERLRVVRDIEPAALSALVPTFLLQPLAENAIRHGIEPRLSPGTLTISARLDGGTLRLAVTDDGVGLAEADRGVARRGIGLANSEERLRALHGTAAKLELTAPAEGGVRVQVALPVRTAPASAGPAAAAPETTA